MNHKNTLLKKIIILFILVLIPLLIVWFMAFYSSNRQLKKEILSSVDSNNSVYISHLDNSLYTIYQTSYTWAGQSNFKNFDTFYPHLSPYEKGYQTKTLREQLSTASLSLPFVDSTHAYFKNLKMSFNSKGFDLGSYTTLESESFQELQDIFKKFGPLHYCQNPITGKMELEFFILPFSNADYGVCFILSQSELKRYWENNISFKDELFLFSAGKNFTLTNTENPNVLTNALKQASDTAEKFPIIQIDNKDYYAFSYELEQSSAHYTRFIPASAVLGYTNITPFFIVALVILISVCCIIYFIEAYRLIHKPLTQLTNAFKEVENHNFKVQIQEQKNPDFAYLFRAFNDMAHNLDLLIEKDYAHKLLLQKAELKQLQAQINPHFLYNSFFMLQRMIKTECMEEANDMASALGRYFQYLTRNSMDCVSLLEEYNHAKNYAYIQSLRFADRIDIDFAEIPKNFANLKVPKLILQPILENAFNHGLVNKSENGILKIDFQEGEADTFIISIEDNGEDLEETALLSLNSKLKAVHESSQAYEMSGLLNIQRRLTIFSDSQASLHVSRSNMGGACVTITLSHMGEN